MDFSISDKFSFCKAILCKKYLTPNQRAFMKGKRKFQEEFNIFNMIKTIQKIKAALSLVIEQNHVDIQDIKENYFDMCEIIVNEKEENLKLDKKSESMKFFDRDYKDIMILREKIEKEKLQR